MSLPGMVRKDGERLSDLALVEHETGGRALLAVCAEEAGARVGRIRQASDVAVEDWRYQLGYRDALLAVCGWSAEARGLVFNGDGESL